MVDNTDANGNGIGCPLECEYRADTFGLLEYTESQRATQFPWEEPGAIFFKLSSSTLTISKVIPNHDLDEKAS